MTQTSINYGKVLYELAVQPEEVKKLREMNEQISELAEVFASPVIPFPRKEMLADKIFDGAGFSAHMKNFFKVLVKQNDVDLLGEICRAYQEYYNEQNSIVTAKLTYVVPPNEAQKEKIRRFLCSSQHAKSVDLEESTDAGLIGGFTIRIKDKELDYSLKGRIRKLQQQLVRR